MAIFAKNLTRIEGGYGIAVKNVLFVIDRFKVSRIYAERIPANVMNFYGRGNIAVEKRIRKSMRQDVLTPVFSDSDSKIAIPTTGMTSLPNPTRICFFDLGPKSLYRVARFSIDRAAFNNHFDSPLFLKRRFRSLGWPSFPVEP